MQNEISRVPKGDVQHDENIELIEDPYPRKILISDDRHRERRHLPTILWILLAILILWLIVAAFVSSATGNDRTLLMTIILAGPILVGIVIKLIASTAAKENAKATYPIRRNGQNLRDDGSYTGRNWRDDPS